MCFDTSKLCDFYPDEVDVLEPIFSHFGGATAFAGRVTTVKCFENNGLIAEILSQNGAGRILVIDGGGIIRTALFDGELASLAYENEWEGIIVNGAVRNIDTLEQLGLGVLAIAPTPVGVCDEDIGEVDVPVNFAGVSIYPDDMIYADTTGVVLSQTEFGVDDVIEDE